MPLPRHEMLAFPQRRCPISPRERPPMRTHLLQSLLLYAIAGVIVWAVARGVSWREVAEAAERANPWMLISASLIGFAGWFAGETLLYSRLFTYFHRRTTFAELLPSVAAVYFLQVVNSLVASSAFALFLHTRERVGWITSGCTLMFQAYVDLILLAMLSIIAIALVPDTPMRPGLDYAAVVLGAFCLIAALWLFWEPQGTGWARWLYERPAMVSFRTARPWHYVRLMGIRLGIFVCAGFALYGQFRAFHLAVPLVQVLALTPFVMAVGNAPLSPAGIGTTQFVFEVGFARFATREDLMAVSLAVTALNFLFRVPMALASGGSLIDEIAQVSREFRGRGLLSGDG
ncbi:MAG TPA: lysylphosphatidylglycerol synthase transmembrane domain-containing protein [Candidatus Binataceae bacterium]|nr:lysylphosphatidylglycerol synthase transmembrane domain-containing protein [Candidatus Binataceae bacterium]